MKQIENNWYLLLRYLWTNVFIFVLSIKPWISYTVHNKLNQHFVHLFIFHWLSFQTINFGSASILHRITSAFVPHIAVKKLNSSNFQSGVGHWAVCDVVVMWGLNFWCNEMNEIYILWQIVTKAYIHYITWYNKKQDKIDHY